MVSFNNIIQVRYYELTEEEKTMKQNHWRTIKNKVVRSRCSWIQLCIMSLVNIF